MSDGESGNQGVNGRRRIGPIGELPIDVESSFVFPSSLKEEQRTSVNNILTQFRSLCYMEFLVSVVNDWGRSRLLRFIEQMKEQHGQPNMRLFYGPLENATDEPSMFAVRNDDLIRMLRHGDEIERFQGNDFIVSIYAIWEGLIRPGIADTLHVPLKDVKSNIMGDIRIIRHAIVHKKGLRLTEDVRKLKVLGQDWVQDDTEYEYWQITPTMRRALIVQIQSLDLNIQQAYSPS